eukprot:m.386348 g.386348  ORF g.386348 m.386348 type:complete len:288 (+) comp56300_c0_seq1:19-882(+)
MVFFLVGLGLGNEQDITVKGLAIVRRCARVYLEAYTAILAVDKTALEGLYGREVIIADREFVEQAAETFLQAARTEDIALLVVGDPFGATTHTDLCTRCKEMGVPYEVVHNASIMNAIGCCGLQLYNFGRTVSIVFFSDTWRPDSFYDKIRTNSQAQMHTLCLLDIKVKEQSIENLMKGRKIYEPPRFMTVNQCCQQLMEVESARGDHVCGPTQHAVGVARVGQRDQMVVYGTLEELSEVDFGGPLHSLVIVGHTDPVEQDMLAAFRVTAATPRLQHHTPADPQTLT